jgi:protein involved in plasmid replication-relaxation
MATDKGAKKPRLKRRGLNQTEEHILRLVNELRFVTRKGIWRLFFSKGSYTHAGETLKKLSDTGYLTRVGLPHARGASEIVYALSKQGVLLLRALGVEDASWWYIARKTSHASFSLLTHNLAIGQFHIGLRLFVRDHDGYQIIETRTCYQMERQPPRVSTIGHGRQVEAGVIPDSWVHLEVPDGRRFALWIEVDQGTESKTKYLELLRERLTLIWSGQYEKYFQTPSVLLCYLTIGTSEYRQERGETLRDWTEELLTGMRLTAWGNVFRFSSMGEEEGDTRALFTDPVWAHPFSPAPIRLFETLHEQEDEDGNQASALDS